MGGAGYGAATAVSVRVRWGSALAALGLHALALAVALAVSTTSGTPGKGRVDHLAVIALEPPRPSQTPKRPQPVAARARSEVAAMPKAALQDPPPGPVMRGRAAVMVEAKALPPPAAEAAPTPPPPRAAVARPDGLSAYAGQLWRHIAAHRPRGIRQGGTTVVRFRLAPSGALLSAEVATSSGNLNLDKIALRTVRQSAPLPPPPAGATGDQLVFTVAVEFR